MDHEDSYSSSTSSPQRSKKGEKEKKPKKASRGRNSSTPERSKRRTTRKKPKSFSNKEVPRIVLLGTTGAGKSSLGNCLLGEKRFRVSSDPRSCTEEPSEVERGFWYGDGDEFELIDTPGLNDSEGRDTEHIVDVIETLKEGNFVNTFLIVRNGHETRMSKPYTDMLRIFELMFGEMFWKQVVFDVSFGGNSKRSAKRWIDEIKGKFPNAASAKLKTVFLDIENQDDDFINNVDILWEVASTMPKFECKDMKVVKAENDQLSLEKNMLAQEKDELEVRMQSLMAEKSNDREEYQKGLQDAEKKAEQGLLEERKKLEEGKKEEIKVMKDELKMKEKELLEISTTKDAEVMKAQIEKKELEIHKMLKERFDQEKEGIIKEHNDKLTQRDEAHKSELEMKVKEVKDQTLEQDRKMQTFQKELHSKEQEIFQLQASESHRGKYDEEISKIKKDYEDKLKGKDDVIKELEGKLKHEEEKFKDEQTRIQMDKLEMEKSSEAKEKREHQERNDAFILAANQSEEEFAKRCPALLSKVSGTTPANNLIQALGQQKSGTQRFDRDIYIPLTKGQDIKNRLGGIAARVFNTKYPSGVDPNEPSMVQRAAGLVGFGGSVRSEIKKTIMLLGLTGAGKTTFIDAFINYIFDVRFEDPNRLRLIQLTKEERVKESDQAKSQTDHIVVYRIKALPSMNINYNLTIIDTPGFGDTRGIDYDKKLMHNIEDLFKSKNIDSLDAICFVAKAGDARLTAQQKYIFESIFHIFGNDVKDNLLSILTNYDGHSVNILDSFAEAEMNFVQNIPVNSTAIFQPVCQGPVNRKALLDNHTMINYQTFYKNSESISNTILNMTPKSLELTLNVLKDREHIEVEMVGLQWSVNELLMKKDMIQKETEICNQHEQNAAANENTEYEVEEQEMKKVELDPGCYVTNCVECNRTCHYPCGIPNDDQKAQCAAMKNGSCTICPKKCHWKQHLNMQYRIEFATRKVKKTYKEMVQRHKEYVEKHKGQKTVVDALKEEAEHVSKKIQKRVAKITECLRSLKQSALRPDSTTSADYLEQMISAEDHEKKTGYRDRIKQLRDEKDRAENLAKIQAGDDVETLHEKK